MTPRSPQPPPRASRQGDPTSRRPPRAGGTRLGAPRTPPGSRTSARKKPAASRPLVRRPGTSTRSRLLRRRRTAPRRASFRSSRGGARVAEVEGGALGPDPRQTLEVVLGRRRHGRPLQRVAAPRVVARRRPPPKRYSEIQQEHQHPDRQEE